VAQGSDEMTAVATAETARLRAQIEETRAGMSDTIDVILTYAQYARSSRLANRAPRSAIWSSFSVDRPLVHGPTCSNRDARPLLAARGNTSRRTRTLRST
jgi:hypothetical protein